MAGAGSSGRFVSTSSADRVVPFESLHEYCEEQVGEYRDRYDEQLPLSFSRVCEVHDNEVLASDEDVSGYFEEVAEFYDELLQVDTEPYREMFAENIAYNNSFLETMKQNTNRDTVEMSILGSATGVVAMSMGVEGPLVYAGMGAITGAITYYTIAHMQQNGTYNHDTGMIGISENPAPQPEVYALLAGELFHAYQYTLESDTRKHVMLKEGAERGTKIRALKEKAGRDEEWQRTYDAEVINATVNAYAKLCEVYGEPVQFPLTKMGLTREERGFIERESNGREALKYNIGASALHMAAEEHGDRVYPEIFHQGDDSLPDWFHGVWERLSVRSRALVKLL